MTTCPSSQHPQVSTDNASPRNRRGRPSALHSMTHLVQKGDIERLAKVEQLIKLRHVAPWRPSSARRILNSRSRASPQQQAAAKWRAMARNPHSLFPSAQTLDASGSVSALRQLRRRASLPTLNTLQVLRGLEERETVLGVCGEAACDAAIARLRHAAPRASAFASRRLLQRSGREARDGGGGTRRARERITRGGATETSGPPAAPARDRPPQRTPAAESPALLEPTCLDRSSQKSVRTHPPPLPQQVIRASVEGGEDASEMSARTEAIALYRSLVRSSKQFATYNFREYFLRRTRYAHRLPAAAACPPPPPHC
jgi:hypothetical protein